MEEREYYEELRVEEFYYELKMKKKKVKSNVMFIQARDMIEARKIFQKREGVEFVDIALIKKSSPNRLGVYKVWFIPKLTWEQANQLEEEGMERYYEEKEPYIEPDEDVLRGDR
jgi:hypothetical protein